MNPYQAPLTQQSKQCPRCASPHVERPNFTWWGGIVGPRIMGILKCKYCSYEFVGKTGKEATQAKRIYLFGAILVFSALGFVIGCAAVFVVYWQTD